MTITHERTHHWWRGYLVYALTCTLLCLAYLLAIPGDPLNSFLLGYSRQRLLLASGLLAGLTGILVILIVSRMRGGLSDRIISLLTGEVAQTANLSVCMASLVLVAAAAYTVRAGNALMTNPFVAQRMLPVLLCVMLLAVGLLVFQWATTHRSPLSAVQTTTQNAAVQLDKGISGTVQWLERRGPAGVALSAALLLAPLFLYMPIRFDYAPGAAGLYTLISDTLRANHFVVGGSIPYYGPGGIPFAYPPIGFYLMAAVEQFGRVSAFDYVRYAPAVFSLLAMVLMAMIGRHLSGSWAGALAAAVVAATSRVVMLVHLTAGGSIRGLAFAFALASILLFLLAQERKKWQWAVLAGLFAGLTVLTHFSYAEFLVLFYAAFLLWHAASKTAWRVSLLAGVTGIMLVLPWAVTVYRTYGMGVFAGAFGSHGNDYFLTLLAHPKLILPWLEDTMRPVLREPALAGLLLLGAITALVSRKGYLVLWLALVLVFASESSRYVVAITAMLAGLLVAGLYQSLSSRQTDAAVAVASPTRAGMFLALLLAFFYLQGWQAVTRTFPPVHMQQLSGLAETMRQVMPEQARYLSITGDDDAEWLPYLAGRTPVIGTWGAEWLGTYPQQLDYVFSLNECLAQDSLSCVEDLIERADLRPDLLVTWCAKESINAGLSASGIWQPVYENEDFILWKK